LCAIWTLQREICGARKAKRQTKKAQMNGGEIGVWIILFGEKKAKKFVGRGVNWP
jgi:hypothetical protein